MRGWVSANDAVRKFPGLEFDLPISTLRGQYVDNRKWLDDPSVSAIVVGTVDMIGSRLLFEGYRCSRKMRSYHAALLATDTFLVLDEAHLVPPFEAMVRAAADDAALGPHPSNKDRALVPRSYVMALSATGRASTIALSLEQHDLEHRVLPRRFGAVKRLRVSEAVTPDALAATLAARAWCFDWSKRREVRFRLRATGEEIADVRRECERRKISAPDSRVTGLRSVAGLGVVARAELTFARAVPGPLLLGRTRYLGGGLFEPVGG